jgi:geranylgeranyl pyrophosphate synthase
MMELRDEALSLLKQFKNEEVKKALTHYINYVVDRKI